ncbi:hypothetical protein NVV31_23300 [Cytobacillus firmus]|uniref:hypothetical protein n=1 Tax=Cytobacillus firmus TaxID=1399 RepID=UPI0021CAAD80|nr:hypothetical protein [Cytobacillus firmus]MCU1808301.1 hypothetical protein [Cytobacillus firmus]
MKTKDYFFDLFKTTKARELAREVDEYLYNKSAYWEEVEDYHDRYKQGERTDCIGYISKKGSFKFLSLTAARRVCLVLHLGKKLHTQDAISMQHEINELLQRNYQDTDDTRLTPGEAYIRLEWVDNFEEIIPFIDKAYELRLLK